MIRLHHNCAAVLQVSKCSANTGPTEANLHWSGLSAHVPECKARGGGGGLGACSPRKFFLILMW